ncbi:MAG TPA: hypothetical protein DCR40_19165 [Prolixibacteraceae bacterium]|nr:hypothetical protein [Prolixibacteraceae bacterium]
MKKLTIISYSFPPSNAPAAQRPYTIAKYLAQGGFKVSVLSCSNQDSSLGLQRQVLKPSEFKLFRVSGFSLKWLRKRKNKKMANKRSSNLDSGSNVVSTFSKWVFPDKAITWFPFALIWCLFNPGKFYKGNLLTTSPLITNHLLGLVLKFLFNLNWIVDIRDFHYVNNYENKKTSLITKMHKWLETKIIKNADVVSFISKSMLHEYASYYEKYAYKFNAIYNGYDPDDFPLIQNTDNTISIESLPIKIFYAGSFYRGVRSPVPLICALDRLRELGIINAMDIEIEIAGNFENELLANLEAFPISEKINFLGNLPRKEVLLKMQKAHLLWLIVGDDKNHSAGIPLKAFEYIGAKRPILCFAPKGTETPAMIESLQAGWILSNSPSDFDSNVEILKRVFIEKKYALSNSTNDSIKLNAFNRKFQAFEFGNLIS